LYHADHSGDSAPSDHRVATARDVDLFICEATLLRGSTDSRASIYRRREARRRVRSVGRQAPARHAQPCQLEAPEEFELAFDGMELEV
jgi:hypothetical protein